MIVCPVGIRIDFDTRHGRVLRHVLLGAPANVFQGDQLALDATPILEGALADDTIRTQYEDRIPLGRATLPDCLVQSAAKRSAIVTTRCARCSSAAAVASSIGDWLSAPVMWLTP